MVRPMNADSKETRSRVLKAALFYFSRFGLEGSSMRMIADHAQVSSATIHHYYKSKTQLFDQCVHFIYDQIQERFQEVFPLLVGEGHPLSSLIRVAQVDRQEERADEQAEERADEQAEDLTQLESFSSSLSPSKDQILKVLPLVIHECYQFARIHKEHIRMISRLVLRGGEHAYPRRHKVLFMIIEYGSQWVQAHSLLTLQEIRMNLYSWILLLNRLILVEHQELRDVLLLDRDHLVQEEMVYRDQLEHSSGYVSEHTPAHPPAHHKGVEEVEHLLEDHLHKTLLLLLGISSD